MSVSLGPMVRITREHAVHIRHIVSNLYLAFVLTACGGGGSATTTPAPVVPTPTLPPVTHAMGGFWVGVLTFDMNQTSELFVGLVAEDGRFRFLSAESLTQFIGTQQIDTSHVIGSGLGYANTGTLWLDGTAVVTVSTDAMLLQRDSFNGSWSTSSGESGSFDFFYDAEYERASALPLLQGVWIAYDDLGLANATFTIDSTGQFSGQNVAGCTSSGQFSIIDDQINLYQVDSTIANCFIAGDYTGLATIGDINTSNDAIIMSVSNSVRAIVLGLEK